MAIESTQTNTNTDDLYSKFTSKPIKQQIKLPEQKPDTVVLSNKKKIATTGVGAIVGGLVSGIGKFFIKKFDFTSARKGMVDKEIEAQTKSIIEQFYDEIAPVFKKVNANEVLSDSEKQLMDSLGYNHPMMKFLSKEQLNIFYQIPSKNKIIDSLFYSRKNNSFNAYNSALGNLGVNIYSNINDRIIDFVQGNKKYNNNEEFFNLLGDEFKKKLSEAISNNGKNNMVVPEMGLWYPKITFLATDNGSVCHCIQKDGTDIVGMSKALSGMPGTEGSLNAALNQKYGKVLDSIETNAKEIVNKKINKECFSSSLKLAGIGAVVIGGLTLAGTLIHNKLKNNSNNKV